MKLWPKRKPRSEAKTPAGPNPGAPSFNVRAPTYLVAGNHLRCWTCSGNAAVYALVVAPPFDRRDGARQWEPGTSPAVLAYIESLPERIADHLKLTAPRYFRDASQWHRRPYWMNHCEYCGAKIGDAETIESAIAPLNTGRFQPANVKLSHVPQPFEALATLHNCSDPVSVEAWRTK
ncbi:hypothetical protein [Acidocella sp.]|uniref:hypothetical protein n=1 Tax=Acidocella sp. TaxID=50710 RepID=UPI0017FECC2F|nr:hypothetical protein [Acidocella sp.]NNM56239.1 hypothetical protein [Acidocella sp.]